MINMHKIEFDSKIHIIASSLSIGMMFIILVSIAGLYFGIKKGSSKVESLQEGMR